MKRVICILLVIVFCFPFVVYAHPGRTDSSGGHTDKSTGKYHYHHGYSAHDHYDMDKDGDLDCPYDFDDNTSHKIGSSVTTSSNNISDKSEVKKVPAWVYWAFGGLCFIITVLFFSNRSKSDTISEMKQLHQSEIDLMVEFCNAKIEEKNASDAELERIKSAIEEAKATEKMISCSIFSERMELSNIRRKRCLKKHAPLYVTFSDDGMPVYWKPRPDKPYGDYTVFISLGSKIYHTDPHCGGYHTKKNHIFNVIDHARPCKKCAEGFFDFSSVPEWFTNEDYSFSEDAIKVNWRD